jgi:hypothetical protein
MVREHMQTSKFGELRRTTSFWRHSGQFLGLRVPRKVTMFCCSILNHERGIVKSVGDRLFDICDDFWSSAEDEMGVVLEKIISDCTDAILLMWRDRRCSLVRECLALYVD